MIFEERKTEIEVYFQFMEAFMINDAQILFSDNRTEKMNIHLAQILRANAFLLLYNLVEYSISNAMESIYDEIQNQEVDFDALIPIIKKEIIKKVKNKISIDDFVTKAIRPLAQNIIRFSPKGNDFFSGNVDDKEIKTLAKLYGFSSSTSTEKTKNGTNLSTIKRNRNNLSHGYISFKECGHDFPLTRIIEIKNETLVFVEEILQNIECFIQEEKYKEI